MKHTLGLALSLLLISSFAGAQSLPETDNSLTAWYDALEKADVTRLEALMAPDDFSPFEYEIKDLGVNQNRQEFIDSMAEWVGVIDGGSIEYKITDAYEGGYKALVCYRFPGNDFLAEEDVGVFDTKITRISQVSKGNQCTGFQ